MLAAFLLVSSLGACAAEVRQFSGPHQLQFGGADWRLRVGDAPSGPGSNLWASAPDGAWVDARGRLHLRLHGDERWRSVELSRSACGYGAIRVSFASPVGALDSAVVLGLFLYRDDSSEIDVEVSRWGEGPDAPNAQFVVQPHELPGHRHRFEISRDQAGALELVWSPGRVDFTWLGVQGGRWSFVSDAVPVPENHRLYVNLWLREPAPAGDGVTEVVLDDVRPLGCDRAHRAPGTPRRPR